VHGEAVHRDDGLESFLDLECGEPMRQGVFLVGAGDGAWTVVIGRSVAAIGWVIGNGNHFAFTSADCQVTISSTRLRISSCGLRSPLYFVYRFMPY
jgi:hypothetical protein